MNARPGAQRSATGPAGAARRNRQLYMCAPGERSRSSPQPEVHQYNARLVPHPYSVDSPTPCEPTPAARRAARPAQPEPAGIDIDMCSAAGGRKPKNKARRIGAPLPASSPRAQANHRVLAPPPGPVPAPAQRPIAPVISLRPVPRGACSVLRPSPAGVVVIRPGSPPLPWSHRCRPSSAPQLAAAATRPRSAGGRAAGDINPSLPQGVQAKHARLPAPIRPHEGSRVNLPCCACCWRASRARSPLSPSGAQPRTLAGPTRAPASSLGWPRCRLQVRLESRDTPRADPGSCSFRLCTAGRGDAGSR